MTYIANKLAEAAERSLFVSQQLEGSKAWADFAAGSLQVCDPAPIGLACAASRSWGRFT